MAERRIERETMSKSDRRGNGRGNVAAPFPLRETITARWCLLLITDNTIKNNHNKEKTFVMIKYYLVFFFISFLCFPQTKKCHAKRAKGAHQWSEIFADNAWILSSNEGGISFPLSQTKMVQFGIICSNQEQEIL